MIRLMYLLKLGIAFVHSKLDPSGYALRLGVQLGRDVKFYGMKPFMFGSEPWSGSEISVILRVGASS